MENGSIIPIEPDCDEEPTPVCEREAEVVMGIIDKWNCCSKEVCGMYEEALYSIDSTKYVDTLCEKAEQSIYNALYLKNVA